MPGSPSIELGDRAYCLMFLHACKHPTKAVNGLLLGIATDNGIKVETVLPLFHSSFALSPMLEVALTLADEHCKSSHEQLVGYYQANELSDDLELGAFGKKIAQKIQAQCAQAIVLLIDGARMRPTTNDLRLVPLNVDGKPAAVTPSLQGGPLVLKRLEDYIEQGVQRRLVDFDAHLEDAQNDWFNAALLK
uniref:MPN domain-containing protein n=1 Tax=Strombidinopsis acuminata TaxID=141414 RepID=A0A7S3TUY4_9SPIT|mmetsp:Transcript_30265/g.82802  ORF Transcript_30265/g.82802 Transcript_30265/m.82802 type:complete len:191 (+) Transcript_30265:66-638(+)